MGQQAIRRGIYQDRRFRVADRFIKAPQVSQNLRARQIGRRKDWVGAYRLVDMFEGLFGPGQLRQDASERIAGDHIVRFGRNDAEEGGYGLLGMS